MAGACLRRNYACRSSAAAGFCAEWDILDKAFPMDEARRCIEEIKANRKYWAGDYYPLTPWSTKLTMRYPDAQTFQSGYSSENVKIVSGR